MADISTIFVGATPRIAVDVTRPAAERGGDPRPLVMFLHGNGFSRLDWHEQLHACAPHVRAAAWDVRGHGASDDYEGPFRFADACDDLARVLDHLGAGRAHLVGHSLGGRVVLEFQRRHPERVKSIVFASVSAKREAPLSAQELSTRLARRVVPLRRGDDLGLIADANARHYLAPGASAELFARVVARLAAVRRDSYAKTLETVVSYTDFPSYDSVAVPSLVLTGALDPQATPDFARACARAIPGARLALIEGAGHMVNMEQPAAFNETVLEFIRALEKSGWRTNCIRRRSPSDASDFASTDLSHCAHGSHPAGGCRAAGRRADRAGRRQGQAEHRQAGHRQEQAGRCSRAVRSADQSLREATLPAEVRQLTSITVTRSQSGHSINESPSVVPRRHFGGFRARLADIEPFAINDFLQRSE